MSFPTGQLLVSRGVDEMIRAESDGTVMLEQLIGFMRRHTSCDWGDLCDEDKDVNNHALECGARILSAYHLLDGTKIWIITEADRSVTTILFPSEY